MLMKAGEHWHCSNPLCRCEVLVARTNQIDGCNPVCACGAFLKKKYAAPIFTYLDFLRTEKPVISAQAAQKE